MEFGLPGRGSGAASVSIAAIAQRTSPLFATVEYPFHNIGLPPVTATVAPDT
jgi:hypothetical protein